MYAVTNTIENGFVHIPETADWVEPYLYELTIFHNGKFDDQVDSTSQALRWARDGYSKHRYGLIEYLKMEAEKLANPASKGPPICSKCNVPMLQRIPGGFRCAHCGEQWSSVLKPRGVSRYDVLRSRGLM